MMDVRYCVSGSLITTDAELLDAIQAALPPTDSPRLGMEYTESREPAEDSDAERLAARMTFADSEQGQARAEYLFEEVTTHDLATVAEDCSVRLYRTPEGGVTQQEVREYYETHPDEQPVDEDGEPFVPSSWDPERHIIDESSV